ncbi:virulence factor, BrkB family protein [Campylobacter iguaniorum]|uniref:YihY/virulence factor BrkB family protein n=1 Tax=Campylobacter iguaniorum TaxID=1244531 RepID=UPI0007C9974C|nr:YihY/virulence factor BrkB family protein [Campylobacter iguaniorum]ANE35953.1 virulence factor, BrkB family protein [Campylobacter iguaniorum]
MSLAKTYMAICNFYKKWQDKDLLHFAASLSFHTMLSIIPILLISLSIFTQMPSFSGYYTKIKEFIFSNLLPSHQESITNYIDQFLSNSSSLGIMGFVAIIFTSIMFFSDFEYVVSKITGAKSRGFWRSLSNYWTLITLMPLGLAMSFYLSNLIQNTLNQSEYTSEINFLAIFPYLIIWAIFAITYLIIINREISLKTVLISSFISSLAWSISKWFFVQYAFYNKTYASIYGSFSILLFFFVWIYLSWIIFLYGVKLCAVLEYPNSKDSSL